MFVWVIAMIVGSIPVGSTLATNSTVTNPVQGLMSYATVWSEQSWGSALVYPIFHTEFFGYLLDIMLLNFPIFGPPNSPWQILRWIILGPVIATVVFGLVLTVLTFFRKTI